RGLQRLGQLVGEGAGGHLAAVVEEVFLELVEHHEQGAAGRRGPAAEDVNQGGLGRGPSTVRPRTRPTVSFRRTARPSVGASFQSGNETATNSGVRPAARCRGARTPLTSWATPASRSDDLPQPLGPYRTVSRAATRLEVTTARSVSRPKK